MIKYDKVKGERTLEHQRQWEMRTDDRLKRTHDQVFFKPFLLSSLPSAPSSAVREIDRIIHLLGVPQGNASYCRSRSFEIIDNGFMSRFYFLTGVTVALTSPRFLSLSGVELLLDCSWERRSLLDLAGNPSSSALSTSDDHDDDVGAVNCLQLKELKGKKLQKDWTRLNQKVHNRIDSPSTPLIPCRETRKKEIHICSCFSLLLRFSFFFFPSSLATPSHAHTTLLFTQWHTTPTLSRTSTRSRLPISTSTSLSTLSQRPSPDQLSSTSRPSPTASPSSSSTPASSPSTPSPSTALLSR